MLDPGTSYWIAPRHNVAIRIDRCVPSCIWMPPSLVECVPGAERFIPWIPTNIGTASKSVWCGCPTLMMSPSSCVTLESMASEPSATRRPIQRAVSGASKAGSRPKRFPWPSTPYQRFPWRSTPYHWKTLKLTFPQRYKHLASGTEFALRTATGSNAAIFI